MGERAYARGMVKGGGMATCRSEDSALVRSGGVSRREALLGIGATGLAAVAFAKGLATARAQEATPAPAGGLPPGVGIAPVIDIPIRPEDVPTGPFKVSVYHLTMEPGAVIPESSFPYPNTVYVESGTLVCPGFGPRYIIGADGSVREVGDEDATINTGEAIYHPPDVVDGAENRGTEVVSLLAVDLVPGEAMATPSA
jgi:quercetin dioxygenase-like cupin family protein